ncbi:MAG: ATP-dependent Clp protease adaptor ClpS [Phycisphaerales bacterium]
MSEKDRQGVGETEGAGQSAGTAVATQTRTAPPKVDRLPPFRVLLHNDEVNDLEHVVRSITELTPLKKEEAVTRTLEAHKTGVALLLVTHRERAELYREQFGTKNLAVTIEPAE